MAESEVLQWDYYRVLVLEDSVGAILLLIISNNINKESNKIKNQRIEKITSLCYFI